jgi:hypothetical protein
MRMLLVLFATSLVCSVSLAQDKAPASPQNSAAEESVSLSGTKAKEMGALVEKLKGSKAPKEAVMDVTCQYPTSPEAGGTEFCVVRQAGSAGPEVTYKDNQAKRMRTLLESAHADEPDDSPCGAGSCHVKGSMKVVCDAKECRISEANNKAPQAAGAAKDKKTKAVK